MYYILCYYPLGIFIGIETPSMNRTPNLVHNITILGSNSMHAGFQCHAINSTAIIFKMWCSVVKIIETVNLSRNETCLGTLKPWSHWDNSVYYSYFDMNSLNKVIFLQINWPPRFCFIFRVEHAAYVSINSLWWRRGKQARIF